MYKEGHTAPFYDKFSPGTDAYKERERELADAVEAAGGDTQVYVGNMPLRVTEDDLRAAFEPFGDITAVRLIDTRRGGQKLVGARSLAFVTFSHAQAAKSSIAALNGTAGVDTPITDADDTDRPIKVKIQRAPAPVVRKEPECWANKRGGAHHAKH